MGTSSAAVPSSPVEFAFPDLEQELSATRRLLERFPDGRGDWRPHEKSMTLAQLASHIAELPMLTHAMVDGDSWDMAATPYKPIHADTREGLLAIFDGWADRLRTALGATDAAALERTWAMHAGERVFFSGKRGPLVRRMGLTHLAHHRGQLTVYYRLLDVPVPGLFGPSADEQ